MPPRPTLPNTVKLEIAYTGPNGVRAANIQYALMGTGWTPTVSNLTAVANNYLTALKVQTAGYGWNTLLSTGWAISTLTATDVGGTTENSSQIPYSGPPPAATIPLSPNVALCISWTIAAHYRGGHPRTYVPGQSNTAQTSNGSNQWTNAFRSIWAATAQGFLQSFNAALVGSITEALGSMSYHRNNVPLTTPVFYPYLGGNIHGRLDSQRRRLGKESVYL